MKHRFPGTTSEVKGSGLPDGLRGMSGDGPHILHIPWQ